VAQAEESLMFTFEIADQKEVRRFRIAQFNGRAATARSNGKTITGLVRSIVENKSSIPRVWEVTLIPTEPKAAPTPLRPAPRFHSFTEDLY
jgi:hypothetical protein